MKISKKQLIKLIKETIYVDPKGVAMRDVDAEKSALEKEKLVSSLDPRLDSLMKGSAEDKEMARELARSGFFGELPLDIDYHGAEKIYLDDPQSFRKNIKDSYIPGQDYYVIIFGMYCGYDEEDVDVDALYKFTIGRGLVIGELPAGSLPGENYSVRYLFGSEASFDGDPYTFLETLAYELDVEAAKGGNRPCNVEIYQQLIVELGIPTDHVDLLKKVLLKNSQGLNTDELAVARLALTQNGSSESINQLKQMGITYPGDVIYGLHCHFMAMAAQKVLGLTTNTIVDDVLDAIPDNILESECVYD